MGAKKIRFDNLVGIGKYYDLGKNFSNHSTLVEAWENGWWYSAVLPNNKLAIVCMTDSDLVNKYQLKEETGWKKLLSETVHSKKRTASSQSISNLKIWPAASQYLDQLHGKNWLAIGDAANTFDPLSSQGIFKAMKEGIFGSYAIIDYLDNKTGSFYKYEWLVKRDYEDYLKIRKSYYKEEQRWNKNPFWERRFGSTSIDSKTKIITNKTSSASPLKSRYLITDQEEKIIRQTCTQPATLTDIVKLFSQPPFDYKKEENISLMVEQLIKEGVLRIEN